MRSGRIPPGFGVGILSPTECVVLPVERVFGLEVGISLPADPGILAGSIAPKNRQQVCGTGPLAVAIGGGEFRRGRGRRLGPQQTCLTATNQSSCK